jgi:hypothetical protein
MRAIPVGIAIGFLWCGTALAQSAPFKCPKPGTVVEYEDGSVTEWIVQEANYCRTNHKPRNEDARLMNWYAPMASVPVNGSLSWLDQVKPQTIWPLSVGKKISARYDGAATVGSYQGSWTFTYTVEKYEKITTKAGTFDAFLITRLQDGIGSTFREKWSQWYAPELGISVRYDYWNNQGRTNKGDAVAIKGQ